MSIYGTITKVEDRESAVGTLVLTLEGPDGENAGQRRLYLDGPTWRPEPGQTVDGSSDSVVIYEGETEHRYRRLGYTTIVEDHNK